VPQTLIEKIAQAHAVGLEASHQVRSGDFLSVRPAHVMTHDNTAPVIAKFGTIGASSVVDPAQPVFCIDHDVQNRSADNLAKYENIEAFAREQGVRFHPAGRGIGHQVMCEEGFVLPGTLVVASDSHSNLYGGLAALGTPVVRTDAAAIWATGTTWYQVPPITRVELTGSLRPGVAGKDVIVTLCGTFNQDEVLNHALEFTGPGVAGLSIEERLTIANMTTEWGALAGVFDCDARTIEWLEARFDLLEAEGRNRGDLTRERIDALRAAPPVADADAVYAQTITLDLARVEPSVSGPDHVKVMQTVGALREQRIPVHKAYILSCVNGRADDFGQAAAVVRGRRVADSVELYIAAASSEVEEEAKRRGDWQALIEAGAKTLPAGCGPCIGLGSGTLGPDEVGISATNRNFKGRMGDRSARAYLASPAVVAASAVAGHITDAGIPGLGSAGDDAVSKTAGGTGEVATVERAAAVTATAAPVTILEGFPPLVTGELLFVDTDNLNTDGIYGKDVTYRDDLTPEQMATHAMANYDPEFQEKAREGDILVGGYNFGTGSSREQAATSLKYRGIRLVIAGSFSTTYMRNAFNNGYVCLECPELVEDLRQRFGEDTVPTRRTGIEVTIDFERSVAAAGGKRYAINPLGAAAQELVLAGGLEALVRRNLGL
jgi:homoaconitate hydratase